MFINATDSTSEAGEGPQPGAVFELGGGVFDASPSSPPSCLSSPRYAGQGFLASTAWDCSPDEPYFTTCLPRPAHRKLGRGGPGLKLETRFGHFNLKFTVFELSWLGCPCKLNNRQAMKCCSYCTHFPLTWWGVYWDDDLWYRNFFLWMLRKSFLKLINVTDSRLLYFLSSNARKCLYVCVLGVQCRWWRSKRRNRLQAVMPVPPEW